MGKTPQWDSRAMKRAIAKHDAKFASKHGAGKKSGCFVISAVVAAAPVAVAVAAVKGWA